MKNRVGEKHVTNEGYDIEIVEYFGCENSTILFNSGDTIKNIIYKHIKDGQIKNPYHKSVLGIGFFGVGKYNSKTHCKIYNTWQNMLQRCYDSKEQEKNLTYKDVTVCEKWNNFQNFAQWYEENYKSTYMQDWHLDKDILFKGNKIYNPETCCFVPQEINKLFIKSKKVRGDLPIGVRVMGNLFQVRISKNGKSHCLGLFNTPEEAFQTYKTAKEQYIKEIADQWKDLIDSRVYQALINYKVEIDD